MSRNSVKNTEFIALRAILIGPLEILAEKEQIQ